MPHCCIVQCTAREAPKQSTIFHRFPSNPIRRKAWTDAIGEENIMYDNKILYVCSLHFADSDYYTTVDGFDKLKNDAVPAGTFLQSANIRVNVRFEGGHVVIAPLTDDYHSSPTSVMRKDVQQPRSLASVESTPCITSQPPIPKTQKDVKVCRTCLEMERKLYSMAGDLTVAYEMVASVSVDSLKSGFPPYLCVECSYQLLNFIRFRNMSRRAHRFLTEVLDIKDYDTTIETIKKVKKTEDIFRSKETNEAKNTRGPVEVIDESTKDVIMEDCDKQVQTDELLEEIEIIDDVESGNLEEETVEMQIEDIENPLDDTKPQNEVAGETANADEMCENVEVLAAEENEPEETVIPSVVLVDPPVATQHCENNQNLGVDTIKNNIGVKSINVLKGQISEIIWKGLTPIGYYIKQVDDSKMKEKPQKVQKRKETQFKCETCFKIFEQESAFQTHINRHKILEEKKQRKESPSYVNAKFKCETCFTGFEHEGQFQTHLKKHRKLSRKRHKEQKGDIEEDNSNYDNSKFKCDTCLKGFVHEQTYKCHMDRHVYLAKLKQRQESPSYINAGFKCKTCFLGFEDEELFNDHIKRHRKRGTYRKKGEIEENSIETNMINGRENKREHMNYMKDRLPGKKRQYKHNESTTNQFNITPVTLEEELQKVQERKESSNYVHAGFQCEICYKGFLMESAFQSHQKKHTEQHGSHECEICKLRYKTQLRLRKHIYSHHLYRYSCKQCSFVTTHTTQVRHHELWHRGKKYACPHCEVSFNVFTSYLSHVRLKHPSADARVACPLCGYCFVSHMGMRSHLNIAHQLKLSEVPQDGPQCEVCQVRFASQEAYDRHLEVTANHNRADRPSRRNEACANIKKVKYQNLNTKNTPKNQNPNTENTPIPCEQCGVLCKNAFAYNVHFRWTHRDKNRTYYPLRNFSLMCEICGAMFSQRGKLDQHLRAHSGENPYSCEQCGKRFAMKMSLYLHSRTHGNRTRYPCPRCGRLFSNSGNRQRHMAVHSSAKPHSCACGKAFATRGALWQHERHVHQRAPWPRRRRAPRSRPKPAAAPEADLEEEVEFDKEVEMNEEIGEFGLAEDIIIEGEVYIDDIEE